MGYTLLDHSTDALVEVRAATMDAALEDAAYAAIDIMLDRSQVRNLKTCDIAVDAPTIHEALYAWLEEIIYQVVTEGFATSKVSARYVAADSTHTICARVSGEMLDVGRHRFGVEIKAPTYHEMHISESDGVLLRFLMDL